MIMTFLNAGNNAVDLSNMSVIQFILLMIVGMVAAATMVIPGVSGGTLALTLGIYQDLIGAISNFFKNLKKMCFTLMFSFLFDFKFSCEVKD